MLFTEDRIICISKRKRFKLDHKDLFLFTNFVRLNDSFKQSESFTPFCFPSFNASAFLYVYVSYLKVSYRMASVCECVSWLTWLLLLLGWFLPSFG